MLHFSVQTSLIAILQSYLFLLCYKVLESLLNWLLTIWLVQISWRTTMVANCVSNMCWNQGNLMALLWLTLDWMILSWIFCWIVSVGETECECEKKFANNPNYQPGRVATAAKASANGVQWSQRYRGRKPCHGIIIWVWSTQVVLIIIEDWALTERKAEGIPPCIQALSFGRKAFIPLPKSELSPSTLSSELSFGREAWKPPTTWCSWVATGRKLCPHPKANPSSSFMQTNPLSRKCSA